MPRNLIAAIIFALAFFLFFVLILPQYDAIKIVREAIKLRQSSLDERMTLLNNVLELDRQAGEKQVDIGRIKTLIPEKKQLDEVVSSLQKITEQSGVQLFGLSTSEVAGEELGAYKKFLISMDMVGTYPALLGFLKLSEQSLRLYDISGINAATSITTLGGINIAIRMYAYYLK